MPLFWRIILGLVISGTGFFIIYKTLLVQGWVGRIAWAEQHLGAGGTTSYLKILGLLIIFIGILVATGIINDVMGFLAGFFSGFAT